jgi:hypothetical protein
MAIISPLYEDEWTFNAVENSLAWLYATSQKNCGIYVGDPYVDRNIFLA